MPALVLEHLDDITRLSDSVVRILGQNPGSFTLQGTNTYLVGSSPGPFLLIDTGEGKPAYLSLLASCLGPEDTISDIVITHKHKDHWGGLAGVLGMLSGREGSDPTKPRVWKWRDEETDGEIERSLPPGTFQADENGKALHGLVADQIISTSSGPTSLRVIHTPGHTPDSICLFSPSTSQLFTADTVLGQSTPVFTSLLPYLTSLRTLLSLHPQTLFPGHGPVLPSGTEAIQTLISHRQGREDQIVALLRTSPPGRGERTVPGGWDASAGRKGTGWTTEELVGEMYREVGTVLKVAAARGVDLHLGKLEEEGRVRRGGWAGGEVEWKWVGR